MVVLIEAKIKAADKRPDCAVSGIGGDERRFHLRQLRDYPTPLVVFLYVHNGAAPDTLIGGCLIPQHFLRKLKPVGGDFNDFAALCVNLNRSGASLEHERWVNVIALG